jgi:hypothetical protein
LPADNAAQAKPSPSARAVAPSGLLILNQETPGLLALTSGRLKRDPNGCTIIANGKSTYLAVWPLGTELAADAGSIIVPRGRDDATVYRYGAWASFPGGALSNVDGGSDGFKSPGNEKCRGRGWAVSP